MTIDQCIRTSGLLRIDAELLMAHTFNMTRSNLFARGTRIIAREEQERFEALVQRRKLHEPLAYITGRKEFYGRSFSVTPDVLIPRPATEGIIDAVNAWKELRVRERRIQDVDTGIVVGAWKFSDRSVDQILDVGTGSGCIAITLQLLDSSRHIVANDISQEALEVARKNAKAHGCGEIAWDLGDGPECIATMTTPFLLVSNPPYIPSNIILPNDVSDYEPAIALWSGEKGVDCIEGIVRACSRNVHCIGMILECRAEQIVRIDTLCGTL